MTDWLPYLGLALQLLIVPALKIMWDIRAELIRVNGKVQSHEQRIERLERAQDAG